MNSKEIKNYYEFLNIDKTADANSIEKARNNLKYKGPGEKIDFSEWKKIDAICDFLLDPQKRMEYDKKLQEEKNIKDNDKNLNNGIDIYSNSDKTDSSILNMKKHLDIHSAFPKIKRVGKEFVSALPTALIVPFKIIKEIKKYRLIKSATEKSITEVKTNESDLIEIYAINLNKKIDRLLSEKHSNYSLEIAKSKYENYIDLLKKRIQLKENEVVKKGHFIIYKLELTFLRRQLDTQIKQLEKIKDKIKEYKGTQSLTRINDELIKIEDNLVKTPEKNIFTKKKLEVKKQNLIKLKKAKIQRVKSMEMVKAIFVDSFVYANDFSKNIVEKLFMPEEEIDKQANLKH